MKEKLYTRSMKNGGEIVLHRLLKPASDTLGIPIIVAHGTLSNAEAVRDLALYLSSLGFDCWLLEWGGHGHSIPSSRWQNFEYPALNDAPTAIDEVLKITGHKQLFWLSHSGGGHLPLMHLARNPDKQKKIAGIVTLGTQATDAAQGLGDILRAYYILIVSNILGGVPQKFFPINIVEGEPTRLLSQWAKWNLKQKWLGKDGFDYMANLSGLNMPFFMIAGGDDTIAPLSGCLKFYENIGSQDKSWLECSRAEGFSKDYNHGQLVRGSATKNEVFPKIAEWFIQRNH